MILDLVTNIVIILYAVTGFIVSFRTDGKWDRHAGILSMRFFTIQSNLFSALASLAVVLTIFPHGPAYWAWILKYVATVSVTVTLLTVLFFLGPTIGYKVLLSDWGFYLHFCGPLLSLVSFCFLERSYDLPFSLSLIGMLPVVIYGTAYLYLVVFRQYWDDFYGFNNGGRWYISYPAMMAGGFLVCVVVRALYLW